MAPTIEMTIQADDLPAAVNPCPNPEPPARRPRRGGIKMFGEISLLTGPALIVFLGFVIIPLIYAAYVGLFSWKGFGKPTDFIGLKNYLGALTDPLFWWAALNNLEIAAISLIVQGPLALVMALLLNRKMKGRGLLRVLLFIPYVISEAIVGIGWSLFVGMSGAKSGAVNAVLNDIGLSSLTHAWLEKGTSLGVLLLICTWKYIGFAVILFLAGMQGVPEELSEAAAVDGAGFWRTQWHITIPLLGPTLRIWAFLSIIGSMQLFDLVNVIWGSRNSWIQGVDTMATYMYRNGAYSGTYGRGDAIAAIMFVLTLILALFYQRFVLRRDTEGALTGGHN